MFHVVGKRRGEGVSELFTEVRGEMLQHDTHRDTRSAAAPGCVEQNISNIKQLATLMTKSINTAIIISSILQLVITCRCFGTRM